MNRQHTENRKNTIEIENPLNTQELSTPSIKRLASHPTYSQSGQSDQESTIGLQSTDTEKTELNRKRYNTKKK